MGFIKELFGKEAEELTSRDMRNLISMKKEEDRFLEYKGADILDKPEELSQWVSAFLNAEGGLIIIGLVEDNPKKKESPDRKVYPKRIAPVSKKYTPERVEHIILSNIGSSSRPTIKVYPVHGAKRVSRSRAVYLVEIAPGADPPYQASDGKYYRRVNFTKYALNHYEVADLFGRKGKPSLSLIPEFTEVGVEDATYRFGLRLFVANEGRAVAKYSQFSASFENAEIETVEPGNVLRIDDVHGGLPSIQWDCKRVLHPTGQRTLIAVIRFRVKDNEEPCTLDYTLVCEDMELVSDRYSFGVALLEEAKQKIERGMTAVLTHGGVEGGKGG